MTTSAPESIALWALTENGARLARELAEGWPGGDLYLSARVAAIDPRAHVFDKLGPAVAERFSAYRAHIFFMATGIVVRTIAPHLAHKAVDPAVVVVDDRATWAISLVSGHLGGANRLAAAVAKQFGAQAVITTATDVNGKPAVDLLARELGLVIENPAAIKDVNAALLQNAPICCHDPFGLVAPHLPHTQTAAPAKDGSAPDFGTRTGVYVDDRLAELPPQVLVLRPPTLVAGMGCKRGTPKAELHTLLESALNEHQLARASLRAVASVDLKVDEVGLVELAAELGLPLECHSRALLARITHTPSPSAAVQKQIGIPSVCEAAALTSTPQGTLIVPKMKTPNATVAIARRHSFKRPSPERPLAKRPPAPRASTSSVSAPET
jgi:cobalt-precorrin 5A hydrolase